MQVREYVRTCSSGRHTGLSFKALVVPCLSHAGNHVLQEPVGKETNSNCKISDERPKVAYKNVSVALAPCK